MSFFQQALDKDPTLADAASWLARSYEVQAENGLVARAPAFEQSRRMALMTLKLDPGSAEAHATLGNIHYAYDWDWAGAEREFQLAKLIAPADPYVQRLGAILAIILGHWDDALVQIKAAVAQDPLDPITQTFLVTIQDRLGHVADAEAAIRRMLDLNPNSSWMHAKLAYLHLERGDRDGALAEVQRETDQDLRELGRAVIFFALGRKVESETALGRYIKEHGQDDATDIADAYALRGQFDAAMLWLERAFTQRESALSFIKADTALIPFNGEPRFKAFLRKMNLPE